MDHKIIFYKIILKCTSHCKGHRNRITNFEKKSSRLKPKNLV